MATKRNNKPLVPTNCLFQGCYNPEFEKENKRMQKTDKILHRLHSLGIPELIELQELNELPGSYQSGMLLS